MDAYICSALRTPFGRYGGSLASIRTDDLAAMTIRALVDRHPSVDWSSLDDVVVGCANQAGEDNRNVAEVPGTTVNRLCGSSLDAIAIGARAIRCGEAALVVAGGVEGMSRAPFVMGKAESPFSRSARLEDTTMGARFVNPALQSKYGADTMPETAENVAAACGISRESQDAFAYRSQQRAAAAGKGGWLAEEIAPVQTPAKKGESVLFAADEHPRPDTTMVGLSKLKPIVRSDGTVTAGNASGLNDGAAMLVLASERAANGNGVTPLARVVASAVAGVAPRVMGMGPVPATRRVLQKAGLSLTDLDVVELNEAFAAQAVAVLRELGVPEDAPHVNPNGGAIAIGHPLGASGARLVTTAVHQLRRTGGRYALCTMCIGVGQGIATILERV